MTALYSQKSDVWSNAASLWNTQPDGSGDYQAVADGDAVTIQPDHTVTFDVDQSAWSTGLTGLGIDGTLQCKTTGGPYYLKMDGIAAIGGCGTLAAGSPQTALPAAVRFTIDLAAGSAIDTGGGLTVTLNATEPAHRYVRLTADAQPSDVELFIDANLSSEVYWSTYSAPTVDICGLSVSEVHESNTIAGVTPTKITLDSGLLAKKSAGSYVVLTTRNIEILPGGSQTVLNLGSASPGCHTIRCAIRGVDAGTGLAYCCRQTIGGVLSHLGYGLDMPLQQALPGIISRCITGVTAGYQCLVSGAVVGCDTGLEGCRGTEVTGTIGACLHGINGGIGYGISGTVYGCTEGISASDDCELSGTVRRCAVGISAATGRLRGAIVGGAGSEANVNADVNLTSGGAWIGYGSRLGSAVPCVGYAYEDNAPAATGWSNRLCIYDVLDASGVAQPGQIQAWMPGGRVENDTATIPSSPPVPLMFAHKHVFEVAHWPVYLEIPLLGRAGTALSIRVYIKTNQTGMAEMPRVQLIDPSKGWDTTASKLVDTPIADNTDWQTIQVSYTPSYDRLLVLRVRARNGEGYMHWNYTLLGAGLMVHPGMTGGIPG